MNIPSISDLLYSQLKKKSNFNKLLKKKNLLRDNFFQMQNDTTSPENLNDDQQYYDEEKPKDHERQIFKEELKHTKSQFKKKNINGDYQNNKEYKKYNEKMDNMIRHSQEGSPKNSSMDSMRMSYNRKYFDAKKHPINKINQVNSSKVYNEKFGIGKKGETVSTERTNTNSRQRTRTLLSERWLQTDQSGKSQNLNQNQVKNFSQEKRQLRSSSQPILKLQKVGNLDQQQKQKQVQNSLFRPGSSKVLQNTPLKDNDFLENRKTKIGILQVNTKREKQTLSQQIHDINMQLDTSQEQKPQKSAIIESKPFILASSKLIGQQEQVQKSSRNDKRSTTSNPKIFEQIKDNQGFFKRVLSKNDTIQTAQSELNSPGTKMTKFLISLTKNEEIGSPLKRMLNPQDSEKQELQQKSKENLQALLNKQSKMNLNYDDSKKEYIEGDIQFRYIGTFRLIKNQQLDNYKFMQEQENFPKIYKNIFAAIEKILQTKEIRLLCNFLLLASNLAINIHDYDKALFFGQQAKVCCDLCTKITDLKGRVLFQIGTVTTMLKLHSESIQILKRAIQYAWYVGDDQIEAIIYDKLGLNYYYLSQLQKSKYFHERGLEADLEIKNSPIWNISKERINDYLTRYKMDLTSIGPLLMCNLQLPVDWIHANKQESTQEEKLIQNMGRMHLFDQIKASRVIELLFEDRMPAKHSTVNLSDIERGQYMKSDRVEEVWSCYNSKQQIRIRNLIFIIMGCSGGQKFFNEFENEIMSPKHNIKSLLYVEQESVSKTRQNRYSNPEISKLLYTIDEFGPQIKKSKKEWQVQDIDTYKFTIEQKLKIRQGFKVNYQKVINKVMTSVHISQNNQMNAINQRVRVHHQTPARTSGFEEEKYFRLGFIVKKQYNEFYKTMSKKK